MQITEIKEATIFLVTMSDGRVFTRYAPDCWTERMGESDEQVYACEKLEEAFNTTPLMQSASFQENWPTVTV